MLGFVVSADRSVNRYQQIDVDSEQLVTQVRLLYTSLQKYSTPSVCGQSNRNFTF